VYSKQAYQCRYDSKIFINEYYFDNHFKRKHNDTLKDQQAVCLGNYCDMLKCKIIQQTNCHSSQMATRRLLCQNIIDICFPPVESEQSNQLHSIFSSQFCDQLQCSDPMSSVNKPIIYAPTQQTNIMWVIIGIFTVFVLLMWYCGLLLWHSEFPSNQPDLKRVTKQPKYNFKNWFAKCWCCVTKPKIKAY